MTIRVKPKIRRYGSWFRCSYPGYTWAGVGDTEELAYMHWLEANRTVHTELKDQASFDLPKIKSSEYYIPQSGVYATRPIPDHCLATSNLPWWKRLFRV